MLPNNVFFCNVTIADLASTALQFGAKGATEGWLNENITSREEFHV